MKEDENIDEFVKRIKNLKVSIWDNNEIYKVIEKIYPVDTKQKVKELIHDFEYTERYDKIGEVYYALIRYIERI